MCIKVWQKKMETLKEKEKKNLLMVMMLVAEITRSVNRKNKQSSHTAKTI